EVYRAIHARVGTHCAGGGRRMPTAQVNGAEMYYEEAGSGPPLILLPGGLQGVLASYQPVIEALSQVYRVIAYDHRFDGPSNSLLVVQTWDMVCQDVLGMMHVLGIETAYLGGSSFGAAIALRCAVRYPQRVQDSPCRARPALVEFFTTMAAADDYLAK